MERAYIEKILTQLSKGEKDVDEAMKCLERFPSLDLEYACIDRQRNMRTGQTEVIYGEGKSPGQIAEIAECMRRDKSRVLVTRTDERAYRKVSERLPEAVFEKEAGMIFIGERGKPDESIGLVCVLTAGTSDIAVAREAALCAEYFGCRTQCIFDVGVAGIHRLLSRERDLKKADVIIAVAGMDGALPSVVGGLVGSPVIALPTSVGYGAGFGGLSALLAMLNSCAGGIAVVNIDNGYGAAALAYRILAGRRRKDK